MVDRDCNDATPGGKRASGENPDAVAPICVATVTTDSFVPGTLVTVGTFLKRHPGFAGDLVVIHDELDGKARDCLAAFPRLRFESVSSELRQRLALLVDAHPALAGRLPRFYSLEAFRLSGYRKVLFLDSDLLFRHPVAELFDRPDALLCCGDGPFYRGRVRDATTFREFDDPARRHTLGRTFNAGFLLIDTELLDGDTYADLLALVTVRNWQRVGTGHTDQILYNRYFAGQQTLVGATYNYLLAHARDIRARERLAADDAKVLHFNMRAKPWQVPSLAPWAASAKGVLLSAQVRRFNYWYEAYCDQLVALNLRSNVRRAGHLDRSTDAAEARA